MKKSNREDVIGHLQIMHIWAEFALERDLNFFNAEHMKKMAQWTKDAMAMLKEQDGEVRAAYRRGLETGRTIKWD